MSYSFSVNAATKAEVKRQIADYFDNNVVVGQPVHKVDRDAAVTCAQAFVDLLAEPPEGKHIFVSVNGSVSWRDADAKEIESGAVSVSASLRSQA